MSDNEVVNEFNNVDKKSKIVDNVDVSDDDESSSLSARDAKMKVVDKSSKIVKNVDDSDDSDVENDHSASTNNGFGVDGEPDYKPRKDSTSSSESEADDDLDEVSASSESKSKSVGAGAAARAASPPQPKSRSSSINQSVEEKKSSSSSDTEDEEELPKDGAAAPAPVPVPVARKVSVPHHDDDEEEVEKRASPVKKVESDEEGEELTRDEWELSKRETVHLEEDLVASKASHSEAVENEISEADEDERQKFEDEEEEKKDEEKEVDEKEEVRTNGGSQNKEDSSSSSSDEEEVVAEKPASPKRLNIQSPPSPEENAQEGERTPSPNVPKPNPDGSVTKAYIAALNNNNNNSPGEHDPVSKSERPTKAVKDITQMYVAKTNQTPPGSPKPIARTKPAKDITQLYTGKFEQGNNSSPGSVDKLSPKKHNMSTAVDKNEIRKAYDDVRCDTSTTEWAVFKFDGNSLGVTATGNDFSEFKALFGNEDRGFGYIRIKTGDEMSKRCKFVFVTWVGPSVSVMKKAKMSTDKALMKDIIQNLSVELQLENHAEFSHDYFKMQVDKAAGARYGTGVRDL